MSDSRGGVGYFDFTTRTFHDQPATFHYNGPLAGEWIHRAILQRLNRRMQGRCMNPSLFEKTVSDWASAPLIFGRNHPDMSRYDRDPAAELTLINGVICGGIENPVVIRSGIPSLQADIRVRIQRVHDLIVAGRISLSTGFRIRSGIITPHHVLLFIEDDANLPKDLGTGFIS